MIASKVETNAPGGKPTAYTFDRNTTITWPTTAFILLRLWQFRGRAVERDVFTDTILKLQVKNSSTGRAATEDEISRQIDTSIAWKYIDLINDSVLLPTDRIQFEHDLLQFIASHLD